MTHNSFSSRHIGPDNAEVDEMLAAIGVSSLNELIDITVPKSIRLKDGLQLPTALTEHEYASHIWNLGNRNKIFKTYIGQGYYSCVLPPVIQRNVLENPGWYTAYTPYQSEIAQGRLEALINFQTMVSDLTGFEVSNASLLDEATAAAEAMIMLYNVSGRKPAKNNANKFFVSDECFLQTIDVLKTRAEPLGIELHIGSWQEVEFDEHYFGAIIQYPDKKGAVSDYSEFVVKAKNHDMFVAVAADLLSLSLLLPPGEWGADVAVGSTQRFGVPMGYGGPHAAYFATKQDFKRFIPGRIIGVSIDAQGNQAYRMALQTREQHIRRDKATSNICTSQVLLAIMAGMYAVYHGSEGIQAIAQTIHDHASRLNTVLTEIGLTQINEHFFDTLTIECKNEEEAENIYGRALKNKVNLNYIGGNLVSISLDESTTPADIEALCNIFTGQKSDVISPENSQNYPDSLKRTSKYLSHPVFNTHHSETEMMRYIKMLEKKDLSLNQSMIPLGSCTMKLNAAVQLFPLSWPEFGNLHPFVPVDQAQGYHEVFEELSEMLCSITGLDSVSFQPNSGAQGEYAGLLVIRAYQKSIGQEARNVVLIPTSAHGTNPASAVMAGMKVVLIKCDDKGNIDLEHLETQAEEHKDDLTALMVTYPSTHGVFEEEIIRINEIIHSHGGQVYMDGANMNAQIGLTNPKIIGADVCHLNLHKTFAIPHGGGGPGMGPIAVAGHLTPFLPGHTSDPDKTGKQISSISQGPWGSSLILLISYGYIKMLGAEGISHATKIAILNANYVKSQLSNYYDVLYQGSNNTVAHEMIIDCRHFKKSAGIEVEDIAKRLIDYGFHAPTVSFPVPGTLMIEPTESESKAELDRFCTAMVSIRKEIAELEDGIADTNDNVLVNAPHSVNTLTSDEWKHPYSREQAAYPIEWVRFNKFWPVIGRVDNAFGDRNLFCTCPPLEDYSTDSVKSGEGIIS